MLARYKMKSAWVRRIVIGEVLLCAGLVVWMAVATLVDDRVVRAEEALAVIGGDYYENYFYDKFADGRDDASVENALAHYAEPGFRSVNLVQLLSYDNARQADNAHYFEGCDRAASSVTFWPEEPYGREDYRMEVKLFCDQDD